MKKFLFLTLLILTTNFVFASTNLSQEDIFNAMQQEMKRTLSLQIDKEAKIHFIAFKVSDFSFLSITAFMGGLISSKQGNYITTDVMLRVGNQKEDSSFFNADTYATSFQQSSSFSIDGIRAGLWDTSDRSYKDALATLAKKEGYKKSKNLLEDFDDFSKAQKAEYFDDLTKQNIDTDKWNNIAKETSAQGKIEGIDKFETNIIITQNPSYFLTSENAKYTQNKILISIYFIASARTKEGLEIRDNKILSYASLDDVPNLENLKKQAKSFATKFLESSKGEKAESFIGPVLLEGQASANLFNTMFRNNIVNTKKVLSLSDNDYSMGEFAQKKGLKILPVNFDVIDDPIITDFNGTKLSGTYKVDDEGVEAQKLQLVKNGILVDLPTTRSLIKDQKQSNGHARGAWGYDLYAKAGIGNLFFLPHQTTPKEELKQKFMEYCASEGLEYCYIIKNTSGATMLATKVNAKTGEETQVYGFETLTFNTRTLRDIKFAGDDLSVYNKPDYSLILPSVILSEAELKPSQKAPKSAPLVSEPKL